MTGLFISLIDFYQKFFSPDHSFWAKIRFPHGYCRFYPSCSEYSRQALLRFGSGKGLLKTAWRILRCNPFSRGGLDQLN